MWACWTSPRLFPATYYLTAGNCTASIFIYTLTTTISWKLLNQIVALTTGSPVHADRHGDLQHALDVGTGSGVWMSEMSRQHPHCQFVGCDVVDQTSAEALPPQCSFIYGDILQCLPFDDDQFDLVHQSFMLFHIPRKQWRHVLEELARVCKRGGIVNVVELDWRPIRAGPSCTRIANAIEHCQDALAMDCRVTARLARLLGHAGFTDVSEQCVDIPLGCWGGKLGACMQQAFSQVVNSAAPMLRRLGALAQHELDHHMQAMDAELGRHRTSIALHVYTARK
ncbi:S-adenosyl-L-methionine-dependent methyltransferase [Syncephalis pseudoplumigaleata]|uniref:S-adenosyl-L-methionine-dependent methyltransferase n=1 Tax=Syncephalis pseudoplumigaleata TaxID=1712513 RepID=A0A4V1J239_9FUNG|nr:S-adenosyl-L-methionine-dependent methyltransferase [Syncephalis pseudoplumigaleata]|eukprot:RKP27219.1 S-adenosyl-L-methionine-dependent methyltransferase [Syncephalis pseudoplumigaleata]